MFTVTLDVKEDKKVDDAINELKSKIEANQMCKIMKLDEKINIINDGGKV